MALRVELHTPADIAWPSGLGAGLKARSRRKRTHRVRAVPRILHAGRHELPVELVAVANVRNTCRRDRREFDISDGRLVDARARRGKAESPPSTPKLQARTSPSPTKEEFTKISTHHVSFAMTVAALCPRKAATFASPTTYPSSLQLSGPSQNFFLRPRPASSSTPVVAMNFKALSKSSYRYSVEGTVWVAFQNGFDWNSPPSIVERCRRMWDMAASITDRDDERDDGGGRVAGGAGVVLQRPPGAGVVGTGRSTHRVGARADCAAAARAAARTAARVIMTVDLSYSLRCRPTLLPALGFFPPRPSFPSCPHWGFGARAFSAVKARPGPPDEKSLSLRQKDELGASSTSLRLAPCQLDVSAAACCLVRTALALPLCREWPEGDTAAAPLTSLAGRVQRCRRAEGGETSITLQAMNGILPASGTGLRRSRAGGLFWAAPSRL
ncbi:hypothetical protein THAOC_22998 [Thalassiosira oceanica]|uniref:Uncharacterized protein n=1 Tax=Thalassiosira oceanica TaxID=159749 RepID=K0SEE1_THAOC|nr:hypothetical protein THAOC_22998 [Thalassiosira oceanica]|eukprot:EJK57007.1 hypothetical protein THAOC_22998 [Thalassiosira oceanica]